MPKTKRVEVKVWIVARLDLHSIMSVSTISEITAMARAQYVARREIDPEYTWDKIVRRGYDTHPATVVVEVPDE